MGYPWEDPQTLPFTRLPVYQAPPTPTPLLPMEPAQFGAEPAPSGAAFGPPAPPPIPVPPPEQPSMTVVGAGAYAPSVQGMKPGVYPGTIGRATEQAGTVELPDQQATQQGAGPMLPAMMRVSEGHSSRTVVDPQIDKETAGNLRTQAENLAIERSDAGEMSKAQIERIGQEREKEIADAEQKMDWKRTQMRMLQVEHEGRVNDKMHEYRRLANELAETKVDPNRIYSGNAGIARKIGSVLAIALSGAGQALMARAGRDPGRNLALDMINQEIERDMQAQLADLSTKKAALGAKGNELRFLMQQGLDAREALKVEELSLRNRFGMTMRGMRAQVQDARAQADLDQAIAGNKQQAIRAQMDLARMATAKVSRTSGGSSRTVPVPASVLKAQGQGPDDEGAKAWRKQSKKFDEMVTYKNAIDMVRDYRRKLVVQLAKYKTPGAFAVARRAGKYIPSHADAYDAYNLSQVIASNLRKIVGGESGVMTDKDFPRYERLTNMEFAHPVSANQALLGLENDMVRQYRSRADHFDKIGLPKKYLPEP